MTTDDKRARRGDLTTKAVAFSVALIMFIFVSMGKTTPIVVEYPIEYNTAKSFMVTGETRSSLRVTISGPWVDFRSFARDDLRPIVIDLGERHEPATIRHIMSTREVNPPTGMRVVSFVPSEWDIGIDRRVERMVPINAVIPERPAFGFEIKNVRIDPPAVRVSGPLHELLGYFDK